MKLSTRALLITGVLVGCAIGFFNAWPHVHEAVWQDEASTLMAHVERGVLSPFLHYRSPNNHIGFTSMLAAWMKVFPGGVDVPTLRALPLLLFLLAIPVTTFAGFRLAGPAAGVFSGLAFAASTISANFATQLRGYGPSWVFMALALLCGIEAIRARKGSGWILGYLFCAVASVAVLPTNMLLLGVVSLSLVCSGWAGLEKVGRSDWIRFGLLVAIPPVALLIAYAGVFLEFIDFSQRGFSSWTRPGLLEAWLAGALWDWPWLAPLATAGLAVKLAKLRSAPAPDRQGFSRLVFAVTLIIGLVAVIWLMPNTPFPRTLVPYLPIWLIAIGTLCSFVFEPPFERRNMPWLAAGLALASIPILLSPSISRCEQERAAPGATEYDLCYQYFRNHYEPAQVLDVWADLEIPDMPIVSDFEGAYALQVLESPAPVYEYRRTPTVLPMFPLVVAHDDAQAANIISSLGLPGRAYGRLADTGYFKVYAVRKR